MVFTVSCWTLVALRLPIDQALVFWQQLVTGPVGGLPDDRVLLFMIPSLWLDWMQLRYRDDTLFAHWPLPARALALATAALLWLGTAGAVAPSPFVYQGF
jgi:hypothetical protein